MPSPAGASDRPFAGSFLPGRHSHKSQARASASKPQVRRLTVGLYSHFAIPPPSFVGALAIGVAAGSLAHLASEAREDVNASAPSTRGRQLHEAVDNGVLALVSLPDGRRVFVRDAAPAASAATTTNDTAAIILFGTGLSSSAGVVESLCARGLRVIACEEDLDTPAAGSAAASAVPARADLIAAVLNARGVTGGVVVVAGALEWLSSIDFCSRNREHVCGLLIVDPILPSPGELEAAAAAQCLLAAPLAEAALPPSPLAAASAAISQAILEPTLALTLPPFDPLHILEHALAGKRHHHLFCGADHPAAPARLPPRRQAAEATERGVRLPGAPAVGTRWRLGDSGSAVSSAAALAAPSESDDTVDCAALHTEAVYRAHLYGLEHVPTLAEMLPTVANSVAPTLARSGLHLGPVNSPPDARVAALDVRVAANARACADAAAQREWIAGLQSLSEALPVRVRITVPDDADVATRVAGASSRGRSVVEAEVELRLRLQADAGRRLGHWQSVLPRRVTPVACASPESGRDVFEPDVDAVAAAAAAMAGVA